MAADFQVVCPTEESLKKVEVGIPCSQLGCDRIFPNRPNLRMHLVKTHGVTNCANEKKIFAKGKNELKPKLDKHFYCPVEYCTRGVESKRPFPRLGQLKQHYMTVHAEKKHKCDKCGRGFGMPDACRRHESKCGKMFPCSCGCPFTTREAMLTHATRKNHAVLPDDKIDVSIQNRFSAQPNQTNNVLQSKSQPYIISASDAAGIPQPEQTARIKKNFQLLESQVQKLKHIQQQRQRTKKESNGGKQHLHLNYRNILPKPAGNMILCQTLDGKKILMKIDCVQSPKASIQNESKCCSLQKDSEVATRTVCTQTASNKQTSQSNAETQTSRTMHLPEESQSMLGKQSNPQVKWMPSHRQIHTQTQLLETQTQFLTSTQTQTTATGFHIPPDVMQHEANLCEIETQTSHFTDISSTETNSNNLPSDLMELRNIHQYSKTTKVDSVAEARPEELNDLDKISSSSTLKDLVVSIDNNSIETGCNDGFNTFDAEAFDIHTQTPVSSLDFDFSDMRFSSSSQTLCNAIASVEDNETQTLISSLDLDLADSGTQTQTFLDEMFCSASFSNTETQTWLSNWPDADANTENQLLEDFVHMETQTSLTIPLLSEIEDSITLTDTHTQTLQDDFVETVLMSANVQTQTSKMTQHFDVFNNLLLNSTCTQTQLSGTNAFSFESTDVQTQTLACSNNHRETVFDCENNVLFSATETLGECTVSQQN